MNHDRETNLALFIDFDNVALGARDAKLRFDIKPILERLLGKGKVIVKKAYADWHYYREHMSPLHEAAIELIEIPMPRISGKNSADIRLVVDAMDLCYSKEHIDTFVIISGDSDFSPLVSKLRENNKRVIGIGVKNSSSKLLIGNCDEFIFYDDLFGQPQGRVGSTAVNVPQDKRELFDFLVKTVQSLLVESRGRLFSSLIKDTMTRTQPAFTERAHGFTTFGELLDEARKLGLLVVERDAAAGGTWVVQGLGPAVEKGRAENGGTAARPSSSRRRRRGSRGGRGGGSQNARPETSDTNTTNDAKVEPAAADAAAKKAVGLKVSNKTAAKKPITKKAATKKAPAKKPVSKKATSKKAPTKKTAVKKTANKKTAAKKAVKKKTAKKTTKKTSAKKS